ncbi:MAG TPA: hypothetical protein VIL34_14170 [Actinopolymorphaceae bacterium]
MRPGVELSDGDGVGVGVEVGSDSDGDGCGAVAVWVGAVWVGEGSGEGAVDSDGLGLAVTVGLGRATVRPELSSRSTVNWRTGDGRGDGFPVRFSCASGCGALGEALLDVSPGVAELGAYCLLLVSRVPSAFHDEMPFRSSPAPAGLAG